MTMTKFVNPRGDVRYASHELAHFLSQRGFVALASEGQDVIEPPATDVDLEALKGKEIDEYLRAAELPITGTVEERRTRLQDYLDAEPDPSDPDA